MVQHRVVATPLEIVQLEVGLLQNFCEVIGCPFQKQAALIDPAFEVDRLLRAARERDWEVSSILLTHTHDDHIAGLDEAAEATGAIVRCHPAEVEVAKTLAPKVAAVADGERVPVGDGFMRARYTPGHMPGCICWEDEAGASLITGDVLFVGSCGGVDYPESDPRAMFDTLQRVLASLPEHTRVFPGHDYGPTPTSRLGWELANNPAFLADTLERFCEYKGVKVPGA